MRNPICTKCGIHPIRNKTSSYCKKCHNNYQKDYYKRNPTSILDSSRKQSKIIRKIVIDLKNKPCTDCKNTYPYFVMDFDHIKGKKRFNISEATQKYRSIPRLMEEIAKCELVCANCHRIRTYGRMNKVL